MEANPTSEATSHLRESCQQLASVVTAMHPKANRIEDPAVKSEIFRALFEITKHVEVIKKQLQRAEKRDDSRLV